MAIDRLGPNQIINRQGTLNTATFGAIDLITMGDITNAVSQTTLPTGQTRTTGQPQAVDVTCMVMLADVESVARLEAWKSLADQGAIDRVQKGASVQYYKEDGTPGILLVIEECTVHTLTYPATDVGAAGEAARLSFVLNAFNARILQQS